MNLGLLGFPKLANPPGLVYLGKRVFRSQASHSFVKEMDPDIDEYELVIDNLVQSVGAGSGNIFGRFSIDKGASFDSGNNYVYAAWTWTHSVSAVFGGAPTNAFFLGAPDNDAGYGLCSRASFFLNNRGLFSQVIHHGFARDQNRGANDPQGHVVSAAYRSTRRPSGIQVLVSGGVIVSGEVRLYGYYKG